MYDLDFTDDRGSVRCDEELAKMVDQQFVTAYYIIRGTPKPSCYMARTIGSETRPNKIRQLVHGLDVTKYGIFNPLQMLSFDRRDQT